MTSGKQGNLRMQALSNCGHCLQIDWSVTGLAHQKPSVGFASSQTAGPTQGSALGFDLPSERMSPVVDVEWRVEKADDILLQ